MAGAVLLAFVLGVSLGLFLGRRYPSQQQSGAAPSIGASTPLATPAPAGTPVITKRGRKAGLTPEAFQPADDILERLRKVEAGELDPTELHAPPPSSEAEQPPAPVPDPLLAERERRILERLEQERQDEASDFSKQRDSGEER